MGDLRKWAEVMTTPYWRIACQQIAQLVSVGPAVGKF